MDISAHTHSKIFRPTCDTVQLNGAIGEKCRGAGCNQLLYTWSLILNLLKYIKFDRFSNKINVLL